MSTDNPNDFRLAMKVARLIERVEQIDPEAGQWLRERIDTPGFVTAPMGDDVTLSRWFYWYHTPQAAGFWSRVHSTLYHEGFYDELNK